MKQNQRGFTPVVIILVLVVMGLVGFIGWYMWQTNQKTPAASQAAKQSTSTPAPAPDETADWTAFSSLLGKFSLKYPSTWVQPINKELCNPGFFDRSLYLGPDAQSVLKCGSEFFGQVWIGSVDGDKRAGYELNSNYGSIVTKDVTVNGVVGKRTAGIAKAPSADSMFAPQEGTIEVRYIFYSGGITYSASYTQLPVSTDVLKDFDLIITKTLKFSAT